MKIALLGVSHWHANMHAEAVRAAGHEITASWDPAPEATQRFVAQFGGRIAASLAQALENADFAIVMGRPIEIAERGLAVVEAGVPMLIEKPIGTSAAAAEPLIAAIRAKNAFAAVALPNVIAMSEALAQLSDAGRLGPISHSYFRLINGPPQRYVDDGVAWVLDRAVGGGGALRNLGIHGISAFLMLAGDQTVDVVSASFGRPIHGTDVEDYAAVVLRSADGMLGLVEAGYTFASMKPGGIFEWRVSAKSATLIDLGDRIAVATLDDEGRSDWPATPPARRYDVVLADALKRLSEGRPPAVPVTEGQRAMAIIDKCYALQGA